MTEESASTPERTFIVHPLLFAAYPVLFLYLQNIRQFRLGVVVEPLAVLVVAAAALWGVLSLILRNTRKAGIIVSLSYFLFFSYRLIRGALPQFTWVVWDGFNVGPGKATIAGMGLLFVVVVVLAVRTKRRLRKLTRVINVVSIVLIALPVSGIVFFELGSRDHNLDIRTGAPAWDNAPLPEDTSGLPDIYYIICDAYTRQDILREYYGYDNEYFLTWLEQHGFYVAREGHSNYNLTGMSVPTSLNMLLLPDLVKEIGARGADGASMTEAMKHSRVVRFLRRRGYQVVAFSTGYAITDMTNADLFLTSERWAADEFTGGLPRMTPLGHAFKKLSSTERYRNRILFTLESLKSVPALRSPKFIYAHIMAPHRPFVFGPNGEHIAPPHLYPPGGPVWPGKKEQADYRKFYGDELTFLNSKLVEVVTAVKQKSAVPPVIVIQGDHGACSLLHDPAHPTLEGLMERMSILNAYHLPSGGNEKLYPTITPVNTFRVIFNHYFGTKLPLIEDRIVYKPPSSREFIDVTDRVRGSRPARSK